MADNQNLDVLGSVASVRSGFAFKSGDMGKVGAPIIKIKNIIPPTVDTADCERVPNDVISSIPNVDRYAIDKGDILIAMTGATVGKVGRVPPTKERFYLNQRVGKVYLTDAEKADYRYLYYVLSQDTYVQQMFGAADGSAQANISGAQIERLEIPLPLRDTQRTIAHILGTLDDKIELNRRMNETLEAISRALFKSWFVDFDPVRAKMSGEPSESICQRLGLTPDLLALFPDCLVDSELGDGSTSLTTGIPEGWSISTLAIEAERHGGFIQTGPFGSQLHAADYVTEGVPVVMPQDLVNRRVSLARIVRVTHEMAKRLSRHALKPGDVVYSRRGDVERHALVSDREAGWLCGTGCLLVRLGDAWPSQAYLSEGLDLPVTREWLVRHAVGATMPNLNTSILGSVPLLLPSEPVLLAFEAIASPLRKQQIAASTENDILALVRDALLPKLLSGELRVPDQIEEVAA